jgi:hypothetical protein
MTGALRIRDEGKALVVFYEWFFWLLEKVMKPMIYG